MRKRVTIKTAMQFRAEDLKSLQEQRNDAVQAMKDMTSAAEAEQRAYSEDEVAKFDELEKKVQNLDASIQRMERARDLSLNTISQKKREELTTEEMEERAFEAYLRNEILEERAGDVNMAKGDNGAVIPATIANKIITKVHEISPIYAMATKYNVKGTLSIPYYPATVGGATPDVQMAYGTEFTDLESTSGSFSSISLTGFLAGALTKISNSLINNAQFDVVGFVVDEMATAMARFIEKECLVGTNNKVSGLSTLSNGVTAAAQAAITADEVVKLHDKVKDVYQQNAVWIMSSATRTALRLLRTQDGLYLLNDDVSSPFGTTLLGKPVYVSDNMPEIAHSAKPIYYGDLSGLATKFSEEINIQVLREKYADEHATGVVGWMEFDAKVVDEQRLAVLTMA